MNKLATMITLKKQNNKSIYKFSLYNLIISTQNNFVYLWNTKSGAILKFEKKVYDELVNENYDNDILSDKLQNLIELGIIVPMDFDEFKYLNDIKKKVQYSKENFELELIITPTMFCNYNCVYCFENCDKNSKIMSKQTMNNIIDFINKYINEHRNVKYLFVNWFGGEPLLGFDKVIVPLNEKILKLCSEKNLIYESGIITNGYYLDKVRAEYLLCNCYVKKFQITFDGTEQSYYDRKKAPAGAYEIVKENLFQLSDLIEKRGKQATINLRINVDRQNIEDAKNFALEIKQDLRYNENINIYLGRLQGNDDNYLSALEFSEVNREFAHFLNKSLDLPKAKRIYCTQQSTSSFCIDPNGDLYKCEHHLGDKNKSIGSVKIGVIKNDFFKSFMDTSVDVKCKTCKLYPICLGGCPNEILINRKSQCEYSQENLIKTAMTYINKGDKNGNN